MCIRDRGYPIAKVTTRIALGYTLDEIINGVTGQTYACAEPTLDYVVLKMCIRDRIWASSNSLALSRLSKTP